ncbi:MAG: hypothetical protein WA946_05880 [Nitrospirota bacterium]
MTGKVRFRQRTLALAGSFALIIAFCVILPLSSPIAAAPNIGGSGVPDFLRDPIYRIPLRVHVGESGRSPEDFRAIIGEINNIWLPQAGICFEMQIVQDDKLIDQGMDIWFLPVLPGGSSLNGYFRDAHNIRVRDTPVLGQAPHPAHHPAARTAAHELGHGLSLQHRQDSDDNLMRSKTFGWQLNLREVLKARSAAQEKALKDTAPRKCSEPGIAPPPQTSGVSAMPINSQHLDRNQ